MSDVVYSMSFIPPTLIFLALKVYMVLMQIQTKSQLLNVHQAFTCPVADTDVLLLFGSIVLLVDQLLAALKEMINSLV